MFVPPRLAFDLMAANANCTLIFQVPIGSVTDEETGNVRPVMEPLIIQAIAHNAEGSEELDQFFAGLDQSMERIRGRFVSPKTLPPTINHREKGRIEWKDGRIGRFTLLLPTQNSYVRGELGVKFFGLFQLEGRA